jgi:hypothetical protein
MCASEHTEGLVGNNVFLDFGKIFALHRSGVFVERFNDGSGWIVIALLREDCADENKTDDAVERMCFHLTPRQRTAWRH